MATILSPVDADLLNEGTTNRVGGRVVFASATQVILADAFAQMSLRLVPPLQSSVKPGDLVEVRATKTGGTFEAVSIKRVGSYPEPTAHSEFGVRAMGPRGRYLRARSQAKRAVRDYFESQGFVEVDTPAAAVCPGLDTNVLSWDAVHLDQRELYLITSPEFHMKRLLSSGLPKIYQICHCFRSEELGVWHEPEFMMLEWYRAFADWETTILDTEEVLRAAADVIGDEALQRDLEAPFERISVRDAFTTFGGIPDAIDLAHSDEDRYFEILVDLVEPALSCFPRPIFLTHYPLNQAALARPSSSDPDTAERYELYFRGQELCNGFSELTDPRLQRERFETELARRRQTGQPIYPLDEQFLGALAQGMPPASGTAVGFDRLIATLLGVDHLQAALAFSDRER